MGEDTAPRAAPQFQTLDSWDAVCLGGARSTQCGLSHFPTESAPGILRTAPSPLHGERVVTNHLLSMVGLRGYTHIRSGARVPLRGPSGGGRYWSVLSGSV